MIGWLFCPCFFLFSSIVPCSLGLSVENDSDVLLLLTHRCLVQVKVTMMCIAVVFVYLMCQVPYIVAIGIHYFYPISNKKILIFNRSVSITVLLIAGNNDDSNNDNDNVTSPLTWEMTGRLTRAPLSTEARLSHYMSLTVTMARLAGDRKNN